MFSLTPFRRRPASPSAEWRVDRRSGPPARPRPEPMPRMRWHS